uniref:Uncharacterized protein n=1 Tax=Rhizophora mucronata TaxID=61149 RepID=A0A2P2QEE1_RHIMU
MPSPASLILATSSHRLVPVHHL